ncbi:hypothetical protein pb186bvf_016501 [Paramecium bursaria]
MDNDTWHHFSQMATDGLISQSTFAQYLRQMNYNDHRINQILSSCPSEINYDLFLQLLQQSEYKPIEQEIPQTKLTQDQIQSIYDDFKMVLRSQNIERIQAILDQYQKHVDLVNKIDPQTRQISTFFAINGPDEQLIFQILQMLYEHGANFNFKDNLRQTILFFICRDGRTRIFDYLLQKGNNLNINDQDSNGQTPLFYASRDNRIEIIRKMIEHNVDLNHVDTLYCQTALFYSAKEGHVEVCKLLLEHGCKPNHQDSLKKTAIFYARKFNRKEVIDVITNYLQRTKDQVVKDTESVSNKQDNKQQKKRIVKDVPKQQYKLIYTDERGNQRELTQDDFNRFQAQYPDIANLILNADELIDETMINQAKEDETWEKIAKKIIGILWKSKGAYFFHSPVDPKKFNIPDYFDIVKKPMDFGTIKQKLHNNVYKGCYDFYCDVLQVFENCVLYNGSQNEVGQIGVNMKQEFLELVDQHRLNKYMSK